MVFNYQKRCKLQEYIQKKVTITMIAKAFKTSRATVYTELRMGLSEDAAEVKKYELYNADLAQERVERAALNKVR